MKTQGLFRILLLMLVAFSFASCADEENKIEISQLTGKWVVTEPELKDNYVMSYTFYADKTCDIYTGSPLSNGKPINCTYTISEVDQLITIVDMERLHPTEKYYIVEFTPGKMKWKNAEANDEPDKTLEMLYTH